ncbi:MAG: hypothetical protein KDD70_09575 [Bdellovibrionales bacterium]|nr:hypothetical protein [Bdellovibrionales bacterium]
MLFRNLNCSFLGLLGVISFLAFSSVNGAGADPLALLRINNNQSLEWQLLDPASGETTSVSDAFGKVGNHIIFGQLTSTSGGPQLGTLADDGGNGVTWSTISRQGEVINQFTFGSSSDTFFVGADFDGNGLVDPALVRTEGGRLEWEARLDGFVSPPGTTTMTSYGRKRERSKFFYANLFGANDWIGVVRKQRKNGKTYRVLFLKDLVHGDARRVRIRGKLPAGVRNRPLPVASSNGRDNLVFTKQLSNGGTRLTFVATNGRVLSTSDISGNGTVVVGDFEESTAGEEVGVQDGETFTIVNPMVNTRATLTIPDGILVDSININSFESDDSGSGSGSGSGGGGGSSGTYQCGGTPGVCGCNFLDETDGSKTGFIYKRVSDTFGGIVVVLPNPCGRHTRAVVTLDSSCREIHTLNDNGYANPDATGDRHHFKEYDGTYTGQWYKQNYGSIILKLEGTDACYRIDNPATSRID